MKYLFVIISILGFGFFGCSSGGQTDAPDHEQADVSERAGTRPAPTEDAPVGAGLAPAQPNPPAHPMRLPDHITLTNSQRQGPSTSMGPAKISTTGNLSCTGIVHLPPQSVAAISAPMGGFVRKIYPHPGAYVKRGAPIAMLEHQDYIHLQQEYLEAKGHMMYLEKEYQRQKTLFEQKAGIGKTFEKTEADFLIQKSKMAALNQELRLIGIDAKELTPEKITSLIYIKAPFSGYVNGFSSHLGQYVGQHQEICELINKGHMHLELQIFEKDIHRVSVGQAIQFQPQGNPVHFESDVYVIGQSVNTETRTLDVHGHLEGAAQKLKPGTYVRATIFTDDEPVVRVPSSAILEADGKSYIYVETRDGTFQKTEVSQLSEANGEVVIDSDMPISAESTILHSFTPDLFGSGNL